MKKKWLYIEPYVYISQNSNNTLLFNTYSHKYLEFIDDHMMFTIFQKLNLLENKYCIEITEQIYSSKSFIESFQKIQNGLYGNISVSKTKPFIFYPKINVQSDLRYRLDGSGTKIKRNLTDVFVILNESNKINNLPPLFNKISVQSDLNSSLQVNYEKLLKFLFSAEGSLVYNVEIGGSNIWEYHNLEGLIENLLSINIKSILLSSIQTFIDAQNEMIQSIFDQAMSLKLYFNIDTLYLFEKINEKIKNQKKLKYYFIIRNEAEYKMVFNWLKGHNIVQRRIVPVFDNNYDFFESTTFYDRSEIFGQQQTINEILAKKIINPYKFGKITISSGGDVFDDIYSKPIGNISDFNLAMVIEKGLREYGPWKKTRSKIEPCLNCTYQDICPPLSDYEYVLKKNNLCNIGFNDD